jgi:molecular chaperone DnaJ
VLGVQQDATHDELKDAYRNRALRLRGQRGPGSSDDEIERVEWRMGELNTAWEVLRDPRRRQAYDRQLVEVSEGAVR